jgi:tetratricopeptide (TPR) repeat protein
MPAIQTTQLDRLVAELINKTLAEVRASAKAGPAWGKLGMVLHNYEFEAEARHAYGVAERVNPQEPRWPYLHALLLRITDTPLAISKMERALATGGEHVDVVRLRLAEILIEAGRFRDAEKHIQELMRRDFQQAVASLTCARLQFASGDYKTTLTTLAPALRDPHTAKRAHELLGACHQRLGDAAAAQNALTTASKLPQDQPWPDPYLAELDQYRTGLRMWLEDGQALLNRGNLQEAQTLATRAAQQYPDSAEAWLLLGKARYVAKDCKGAEEALRRHVSLNRESANGQAILGTALLCQDRPGDAVPCFQKAVELKPDFAEAHFNLGFALARTGRAHDAITAFRRATEYSPDYTEAYVNLADLLYQSGNKADARAQARRALELNPSHERALTLLARIVDAE